MTVSRAASSLPLAQRAEEGQAASPSYSACHGSRGVLSGGRGSPWRLFLSRLWFGS